MPDGDDYALKKSSIIGKDGHIAAIVEGEPHIADAKIVDLNGQVIIPTLFNMHCHLGENMFSHLSEKHWSIEKYLAYTSKYNDSLSLEAQEALWRESAISALKNLKRNGISGVCAGRSADVAEAFDFNNMSGYPIMNARKLKKFKDLGVNGFKEYMRRYTSNKCSVGVLLHSLYENDYASIKLAHDCLEAGAEFFSVHIAEDEITALREKSAFGASAVTVLGSVGKFKIGM